MPLSVLPRGVGDLSELEFFARFEIEISLQRDTETFEEPIEETLPEEAEALGALLRVSLPFPLMLPR